MCFLFVLLIVKIGGLIYSAVDASFVFGKLHILPKIISFVKYIFYRLLFFFKNNYIIIIFVFFFKLNSREYWVYITMNFVYHVYQRYAFLLTFHFSLLF